MAFYLNRRLSYGINVNGHPTFCMDVWIYTYLFFVNKQNP